jgi:hypothetical protein
MASFKLQPTAETLCKTCRFGIMAQHPDTTFVVSCSKMGDFGKIIKKPVATCTGYENKNEPTEWDLRQTAWDIKVSSKGGFIGFSPPAKDE